jgi:hypothetical protein
MQFDCVNGFSVLYESTGSYTPDMAAEIDKPVEIAADRYGVSLKVAATILLDIDAASRRLQAETLGAVIGTLISGSNLQAKVHALAIAFGLDALNGFHSQSEIARQLGCTRALISHYVTAWRDVLAGGAGAFDCLKFRKRNSTRQTFSDKAKNPVIQAKNHKP